MGELSVTVMHDPAGVYTPGAKFGMLDLSFGVINDNWPPGMRFSVKGQDVKMVGKVPVREDGAFLKVNNSGGYEWV